jgi:hypothetical protein
VDAIQGLTCVSLSILVASLSQPASVPLRSKRRWLINCHWVRRARGSPMRWTGSDWLELSFGFSPSCISMTITRAIERPCLYFRSVWKRTHMGGAFWARQFCFYGVCNVFRKRLRYFVLIGSRVHVLAVAALVLTVPGSASSTGPLAVAFFFSPDFSGVSFDGLQLLDVCFRWSRPLSLRRCSAP